MMPHAMRIDGVSAHLAMTIRRRRGVLAIRIGDRALVDAEHALDAADHAADRRADHGADRARDAVAFMEPVRGAARNALRLRRKRRCDNGEKHAREY